MNKTIKAALFGGLLCGQLLAAGEQSPPAPKSTTEKSGESDLVTASRKSKATPRKKARLSITDKDVKQSKGKLVILPATDVKQDSKSAPAIADPLAIEKAAAAIERARAEVTTLEAELGRHEQDYYKEDNASFRDEVIVQRFNATRRKLDQARLDLEAARQAHASFLAAAGK